MYELVVLKSPFKEEGLNLYALFKKICKGVYPQIIEVTSHALLYSNELQVLVTKMLQLNPLDRPDMNYVHNTSMQLYKQACNKFTTSSQENKAMNNKLKQKNATTTTTNQNSLNPKIARKKSMDEYSKMEDKENNQG